MNETEKKEDEFERKTARKPHLESTKSKTSGEDGSGGEDG
jgi:hypothetical protein